MAATVAVVKKKMIVKGMTVESNEHTHNLKKQLKCQIFWTRIASFGQKCPFDPDINFQISLNGLNDHKGPENIKHSSRVLIFNYIVYQIPCVREYAFQLLVQKVCGFHKKKNPFINSRKKYLNLPLFLQTFLPTVRILPNYF